MKVKEKKLKQGCSECGAEDKTKEVVDKAMQERRSRIDSITHVLEGVKYKSESEKAEAILSFAKSSLSTEEIEQIMSPGKPDYLSGTGR